MKRDNRWCLICKPKNRTIYWHIDEHTGHLWCWCNKCGRGYGIEEYCRLADVDLKSFLEGDFNIEDSDRYEVFSIPFPSSFVPLYDPRAKDGVEYVKSRGIEPHGDMYFDINQRGIVFPYYYMNHFVGAQIRFIKEREYKDGSKQKITTVPGTRLGLLFYGWNQDKLMAHYRAIVVTEGAFNAISLQQSLEYIYGGISKCPWKVVAISGSGVSDHQAEVLMDLKNKNYKIIAAPDTDEAGFKMLDKMKKLGIATHYSMSQSIDVDWNDILKNNGKRYLGRYFISNIRPIQHIQ